MAGKMSGPGKVHMPAPMPDKPGQPGGMLHPGNVPEQTPGKNSGHQMGTVVPPNVK